MTSWMAAAWSGLPWAALAAFCNAAIAGLPRPRSLAFATVRRASSSPVRSPISFATTSARTGASSACIDATDTSAPWSFQYAWD